MKDVVIVAACRTAIGSFGETSKDTNAAKIVSVTMKEAVNRAHHSRTRFSVVGFVASASQREKYEFAR